MNHTIIMSKYQGLGNDYLILDPKKNKVELQGKKVALLCQRGFGLGADGVLYGPVEMEGKLGVRIYNADGSESAISGNGVRIFAKYLMDQGYVTEIKQLGKDVRITLYEKAKLDPAGIPAIMAQYRRGLQFKADHEPKFILTPQGRLIEELMKFAGELAKLAEPLE